MCEYVHVMCVCDVCAFMHQPLHTFTGDIAGTIICDISCDTFP